MFTGVLSSDAPGVFGSLRRHGFSEPELQLVALEYHSAWERGGLDERESTRRTPESSFNPRPARLIAIALKELALPHNQLRELVIELARNPSQLDVTSKLALGLVLIDDLRHAHLSSTQIDVADIDQSLLSVLPDRLRQLVTTAHANAKMLENATE